METGGNYGCYMLSWLIKGRYVHLLLIFEKSRCSQFGGKYCGGIGTKSVNLFGFIREVIMITIGLPQALIQQGMRKPYRYIYI